MPDCAQGGCQKPAQGRGSLCAMHFKRQERGTLAFADPQERLDPVERFVQACIAVADADSEDDQAFVRALKRARYAARRLVASEQAAQQLTRTVERAAQTPQRGAPREQGKSKAPPRPERHPAAAPVRQGPERQPARHAGVGEGDARSGGQPRRGGDRALGAVDAITQGTGGREERSRGTARPRGVEALQPRARRAVGER